MDQPAAMAAPVNGASAAQELFALTDEQILEIEPVAQDVEIRVDGEDASAQAQDTTKADSSRSLGLTNSSSVSAVTQPPAWLARQMKDPWAGEEARELWEGVQRAQAEAAEYRQVFEKPEAARAAADRARALDEFDAAYFGAAGKSAEETSAARVALAQRMMREDPAAFQEMVLAGVRALEEAKKQGSSEVTTKNPAAAADPQRNESARQADPEVERHLAAYSEFEKAANQDLEKSVGGAIERALQQALPNSGRSDSDGLKVRLTTGVRQEIEKALQGDRQLGEHAAQVLSSRRFDETARAQVVRLINERAQQLVPSATKRVLHDWTQTTLAAHRSKTEKQETPSQRADLSPTREGREVPPLRPDKNSRASGRNDSSVVPRNGRIDYKKLSDEQIPEL